MCSVHNKAEDAPSESCLRESSQHQCALSSLRITSQETSWGKPLILNVSHPLQTGMVLKWVLILSTATSCTAAMPATPTSGPDRRFCLSTPLAMSMPFSDPQTGPPFHPTRLKHFTFISKVLHISAFPCFMDCPALHCSLLS